MTLWIIEMWATFILIWMVTSFLYPFCRQIADILDRLQPPPQPRSPYATGWTEIRLPLLLGVQSVPLVKVKKLVHLEFSSVFTICLKFDIIWRLSVLTIWLLGICQKLSGRWLQISSAVHILLDNWHHSAIFYVIIELNILIGFVKVDWSFQRDSFRFLLKSSYAW